MLLAFAVNALISGEIECRVITKLLTVEGVEYCLRNRGEDQISEGEETAARKIAVVGSLVSVVPPPGVLCHHKYEEDENGGGDGQRSLHNERGVEGRGECIEYVILKCCIISCAVSIYY